MSQKPDEFMPIYCRWAEQRYGLSNVTRVDFDLTTDGPWSEVTPDVYAMLEVDVTHANGRYRREESWSPDILNSILAVMRQMESA